jgi:glutamate dehydrogenase/leucine dehydrogenase
MPSDLTKDEFTGVLTGKGLSFGGSLVRTEATGYGCVYMMENMLKQKGEDFRSKTAIVSGSGNVAQYTVEKIGQMGGKVVAMSDTSGFVYDINGIDEQKLDYIKDLKNNKRGHLYEYAEKYGAEFYENQRPWKVPCDLAFPCATQNEISDDDAKTLIQNGCQAVAEGANMPTTQTGMDVYEQSKIMYAPSKAANAGGVAVSGLEMTQNSMRMAWSREELEERLRKIMGDIHDKCVQYGTEGDFINYRKGANIAGFIKVADAMVACGNI